MRHAKGFLMIGDPQISSMTPGRRKDDYMATVLGKFEQSVEIANSLDLIPMILGDLFDEADDSKARLLTRLIRVLRKFKHRAVVNLGNHDSFELQLTDDSAISVLSEAGVIDLIHTPTQLNFWINGTEVLVYVVPYGYDIPKKIGDGSMPIENVLCLTHADLAFDGAYPGATELFEIEGCGLVVNGHMHLTKSVVEKGVTHWFNPGNIARMTIADVDHLPAVWQWQSGSRVCHPHYLTIEKDVFDLTGLNAPTLEEGAMDEVRKEYSSLEGESIFVNSLAAQLSTELPKSGQADLLRVELDKKFNDLGVVQDAQDILNLVFERARRTPDGKTA